MSKHTPGPWNSRRRGPTVIIEPIGATITSLSGPDGYKEKQDANGYLLAAAPDLLEALESVCLMSGKDFSEVIHHPTEGDFIRVSMHMRQEQLQQALLAIAKARGEETPIFPQTERT